MEIMCWSAVRGPPRLAKAPAMVGTASIIPAGVNTAITAGVNTATDDGWLFHSWLAVHGLWPRGFDVTEAAG